jgi:hypothetical protein
MEENMVNIRHNLKVAQDRKNIYADKNMTCREFKVGEHLILKVKDKRSSLRLISFPKLVEIYYGSFKFLEKIGRFAYIL